MNENDIKRIPRLIAILTQLQTKRLLTATGLADKHGVSVRTIYRDIRALEEAGIPIITEEGKGYSLFDGYRVPPVMFTESEANAMITAEQLISESKDVSFVKEFSSVVTKVKAVLRYPVKDKVSLLGERILIKKNYKEELSSKYLSLVQLAITNLQLAQIVYVNGLNKASNRIIEPFALYAGDEKWILFAYCRLRNDFRAFRLDRIQTLAILDEKFQPHAMTIVEFLAKYYDTPDI